MSLFGSLKPITCITDCFFVGGMVKYGSAYYSLVGSLPSLLDARFRVYRVYDVWCDKCNL